mmetsp:Transcript_8625/g.35154  ORF Transcript_8625/g.35154 Transcript_8625/m.35154 type:complete len:235 (+) Transcript_8625:1566-2270(+)
MSVFRVVRASSFSSVSPTPMSKPSPLPLRCSLPNAPGVLCVRSPLPLRTAVMAPDILRILAAFPSRAAFCSARRCFRDRPAPPPLARTASGSAFSSKISPMMVRSMPNSLGKSCPTSAANSSEANKAPSGAEERNSSRTRSTSAFPSSCQALALAAVTSFMASMSSSSDAMPSSSAYSADSRVLSAFDADSSRARSAASASARAASRAAAAAAAASSAASASARSSSSSARSGA